MFHLANKVVACLVLAILAFSVIAAAFPTEIDEDFDEIEPFLESLSEDVQSQTTLDNKGGQQKQQQVSQLQRRLSYYFTLQQQRYIRRLLAKLKLKYKGYELQQKLKEEFLHGKEDSEEETEQTLEEDSDEETSQKTLELESNEETSQQNKEEDSKEAITEKPEDNSVEETTQKPEEDSNEETTIKPKEESEEESTLKPKEDSEEETTTKPKEDSEEETTSKPKEDSEEETTSKHKEDSEEETTSKPKEDSEEETTSKPKEDSEEETTAKPKEDSEEETTAKPKEDSEEETTSTPKEDSEEETTLKPGDESNEETTLKPEDESNEQTTFKPKEDSSEVTTDKPDEDSQEKTTTKPEGPNEDSEEIEECEDYSEEDENNSSEERSTPSTTATERVSTTAAPIPDATTTTTTNEPACVGYKPHEDISYYLQFDGMFWIKKSCPYGLGFDYNSCACSIKLERSTPKTVQQTTSTEATTSTPTTTTSTTTTTTPETTSTTPSTTTTSTTSPETTTTTTPATTTTSSTTSEATTTLAPAITTTSTTTTSTTTTVKPSLEICNNCVVVNGVGFAPLPGQCDVFIQCQFFGHVPTAASIRRCPGGLFWNQDKLTCDFQENVKCTPVNKCPNHRAVVGDWSAYEIFDGQRWVRLACPAGTMYNSATCGCTDKQNHDDSSAEDNCLDKKAIDGDRSGFMQLTSGGWVRMPCPATLAYSQDTCRCTDKMEPTDAYSRCPDKKSIAGDRFGFMQFTGLTWLRIACPAKLVYSPEICTCNYDLTGNVNTGDSSEEDICRPTLSLTFDQDHASDSSINHFYVKNKGVTFRDGRAHFNGRSRLVVPGLSNMELGSSVYIRVKFMHTGKPHSPQTLLANGICQVRPSVAICSSNASLAFYSETSEQTSVAYVAADNTNGPWRTAVFKLEDGALNASVGTSSLQQPVKGALDRRHRGLIVGAGGDCSNFQGVIEEIQVYRCQPKL